ncbi:hypothetical protein [uncultured Clostridium sp.]|uniref:hypothetical protein n=1 Tax=uncultured Clostridium sp. TaxID=59620 RepID=UPI00258F5BFF|nr:hypothetical protein [uncultured Clostridium sp.]
MKKITNFLLSSILIATITVPASATEMIIPSMKNITIGNNFNLSNTGYGWIVQDNKWYYLDDDGSKHIGLLIDDGKYYYFDTNGDLIDNYFK